MLPSLAFFTNNLEVYCFVDCDFLYLIYYVMLCTGQNIHKAI
jgi:hypothetical protein